MSSSTVPMSAVLEIKAQIQALQERLDALTGGAPVKASAPASGGKAESGKAAKPAKKERASVGPRAWADFTKKVLAEHAEEVKAFKEAAETKSGAHLKWLKEYKAAHEEEWKTFEAAWKEAHPKTDSAPASAAASVASDSDAEEAAPVAASSEKKERKKRAPMSEEAKAKMAEKRKATLAAKKAGAAPAVAEEAKEAAPAKEAEEAEASDEEEPATELLPFKLAGVSYLRPGFLRDGKAVWASCDLWESLKGARGDYAGLLNEESGEIDASAEEPDLE